MIELQNFQRASHHEDRQGDAPPSDSREQGTEQDHPEYLVDYPSGVVMKPCFEPAAVEFRSESYQGQAEEYKQGE